MRKLESEFRQEMGENGMGRLESVKQIDGFIVEHYTDAVLTGSSVISVWRERFDESEHWRRWKLVGQLMSDPDELADMFGRMENKNDVIRFVRQNPENGGI